MRSEIKIIAGKLGIATSSVSRALSGKPGVSDGLRKKVRALAGNTSYAPNLHAAALRTGRREGIVLVTTPNPTHVSMLRNRAIVELGQRIFGSVRILLYHPGEPLDKTVNQAISYNPRAIVISSLSGEIDSSLHAKLRSLETPLVAVDSNIPNAHSILIDRRTGAFQAARLLLLSGCRNPVFLSSFQISNPDQRIEGIMCAYKSLGRKLTEGDIYLFKGGQAISSFDTGYECAEDILRTRACDGMFCYNDEIAAGALRALNDANVKVPEEVRVIGFDNLPFSGFSTPSLTTVAQPVDEPAVAALRLCDAKSGLTGKMRLEVFETKLVVRESAPLPSNKLRGKVFQKINGAGQQ
jgi:LacI family transcriptional regulator